MALGGSRTECDRPASRPPLRCFEREAKSLASLNHPNVARIFGVDQVEGTCFLVLELVPGETLARSYSWSSNVPSSNSTPSSTSETVVTTVPIRGLASWISVRKGSSTPETSRKSPKERRWPMRPMVST